MEDDEEIHSDSSSPSHNRRIAVTVATDAAPPSIAPSPANSLTLALPIQRTPSSASGGREDCWSEGATAVLIDAWGERYLELSRGNLKQKHWKDVADIVDGREVYTKNPKTDIQCKNRIDTVKKKYKVERAKIAAGGPPSSWRFYHKLDQLIGPTAKTNSTPPSMADAANNHHLHHKAMHHKLPMGIPVGLRLHQKRSHKQQLLDSEDESEPDNSVDSSDDLPPETSKRPRFQKTLNLNNKSVVKHGFNKKSDAANKESGLSRNWRNTMSELTQAIMRFGEAYEQAESAKLQQQVEMEKQRMKFTKDLELQRMQYFMKTQLELSRLKVKKPETNRSNNNNHHNVKSSNDINNNNNNNNNNKS